uniref:Large ribosomal subunit protein bL20c n=1 Tax=Brassica oleracea TaxID=3712 RepID=A0A3P6GRR3_BRAOL|nr:unnamed protein product [Brassica oleracea]
MTRIKRRYIARRRRTKLRLFASSFQGAHSRLTRTMTQQRIRALVSLLVGIGVKEKEIFAVYGSLNKCRNSPKTEVFYSYNRFIHNMYKKQLLLNRKILAQIALLNRSCLYTISNEIKK